MSGDPVQQVEKHGRAVRLAALGGVVGPILFAVLVIVGGILYAGFSHTGQKISELGGEGSTYALVQNFNFIMLGLLVIGFAWALARVFGPPYTGPVLIGLFGLSSCIGNGLLPCDAGCQGEATVGLLHNITGMAGFIAAIAGMFVLARRWRNDPTWQSHVGFTRGAALAAIGGLVWFVILASQPLDAQPLVGIAQRIFAAALLVWIAITAARLYRELARTDRITADSSTLAATAS